MKQARATALAGIDISSPLENWVNEINTIQQSELRSYYRHINDSVANRFSNITELVNEDLFKSFRASVLAEATFAKLKVNRIGDLINTSEQIRDSVSFCLC